MVNLLTFMESANADYVTIDDKGISKKLLTSVANRCGFGVMSMRENDRSYYRLKKIGIHCEKLYDHNERSTFNFLDIADLHLGHPSCEIAKIRSTLDYAVKKGVDYVFIAGDLLDGVYPGCERKNVKGLFENQMEIAISLFRKYPLDFRVIPGNHEFQFDYYGIQNPLSQLEYELRSEQCKFRAYSGYIQDFEIAGVIKRMMHLEAYYYHDNVFSTVQRLHEFKEHGGLYVKCDDGIKRPIRFLQCGHIHKTVEIYNPDFNVYISQPGSFVRKQNYYMPHIHVKGEVLDDLRIVRG